MEVCIKQDLEVLMYMQYNIVFTLYLQILNILVILIAEMLMRNFKLIRYNQYLIKSEFSAADQ